jgi:TrmH family RNA methyltransferase
MMRWISVLNARACRSGRIHSQSAIVEDEVFKSGSLLTFGRDRPHFPRTEPQAHKGRMPHETQPNRISPETQPTLDEIRRLQADRRHRDHRRIFFAEGVRNVVHAIERGFHIETLVYSEKLLIVPIARRLVRDHCRSGTPTLEVSPEVFRQVSMTPRASGVGAVVAQRWSPLHNASPKSGLFWILLEAVRSEGNLGSLIRTSEAVGGAGFILAGPQIDPYSPAVVRASMGGVFRQAFIRTHERSLRNWVRRHRCRVVGAAPDGSSDLHRFGYPRPTILVLGEEREGLSPAQRNICTDFVRIPMVGSADSLNLAVAGSLLMYEVYRARAAQRNSGS